MEELQRSLTRGNFAYTNWMVLHCSLLAQRIQNSSELSMVMSLAVRTALPEEVITVHPVHARNASKFPPKILNRFMYLFLGSPATSLFHCSLFSCGAWASRWRPRC